MHDVPVLHYIILAFDSQFSGFTAGSLRTVADVVLELDHFCTNKTMLEIRMNKPCSLRGFCSFYIGPGLNSIGPMVK